MSHVTYVTERMAGYRRDTSQSVLATFATFRPSRASPPLMRYTRHPTNETKAPPTGVERDAWLSAWGLYFYVSTNAFI